jgi:hypothetical protein
LIVAKIAFADMAGVDKTTISKSIMRGKIEQTPDGLIDTEAPLNMIYMAHRKQKGGIPAVVDFRKKPKPKPVHAPILGADELRKVGPARNLGLVQKAKPHTNLKPLDGVDIPLDDVDVYAEYDVDEDYADDGKVYDQVDKIKASVRLQTAQAKRHELTYEKDKGNVLLVEIFERRSSKLNTELKTRFQDLPRRIIPRLCAMARTGTDDKEAQLILEREIDDGLEAVFALMAAPLA